MVKPSATKTAAPPGNRAASILRTSGDRYSRWVLLMKIALPLAAGVLLLLLVVWPQLTSEDNRFALSFAKLRPDQIESLSMVNARYFGVDRNNRPFTVTADSAAEQKKARDMVGLAHPKAEFTTQAGAKVTLEAETGIYYQADRLLDLQGHVLLHHEAGYDLVTQTARVNLNDSTAVGHTPVEGDGPKGHIVSEGFTIPAGAKDVIFTGQSILTVRGATAQ